MAVGAIPVVPDQTRALVAGLRIPEGRCVRAERRNDSPINARRQSKGRLGKWKVVPVRGETQNRAIALK